jgi:small subunit ribosomal protein S8
MSLTDPIADFLTRIRNALKAAHPTVEIPCSKIKVAVAKVLKEEGFIEDYAVFDDRLQGVLHIDLKYRETVPVIQHIQRRSRPGRREYAGTNNMPKVLGGMGLAILSTPKGVMSDREARKQNVGGEVLCVVY